jgi:hypothetical protein
VGSNCSGGLGFGIRKEGDQKGDVLMEARSVGKRGAWEATIMSILL